MFSFLAFVILEIVFEILDYVWNSIAFLDKENSRYRLCPRNFDFWHSAHGVISSLSLLVIVVIFAKIRMNNLNLQSWLGFATFIQLISAYWLYVGITWIEKIKKTSPECVFFK
jgi:kynureninase